MAKKKKYYFNPETTNYEEIKTTFTYRLRSFLYHILSGILLGFGFFLLFVTVIKSPDEKALELINRRIEGQYKALEIQTEEMQEILNDLQTRDNNLYRVIYQTEQIPLESRQTPTNNIDYYNDLRKKTNSEIVVNTAKKINKIKKQLYVQSKSYDELVSLIKSHEKMMAAIPAIQPIANKDLTRIASGFGWRIDPIYRTRRFHSGMDFSAPTGTAIYATGNGTVVYSGWRQGYGNSITINHGYGYETLYGHMSKLIAQVGQTVNRGETIGLVGNTGKSTGPHLHYEVHLRGKVMDPRNYYFMDLTPEEYDRMIQLSENAGHMFD